MVVLVRCSDNSCSVALKSRLNDLVNAGLVTAVLRNGEWITAENTVTRRERANSTQSIGLLAPHAAHP